MSVSDDNRGGAPGDEAGDDEVEASRAPLMSHLEELRTRLIWALAGIAVAFAVCFVYAEWIYNVLLDPFQQAAQQVRGASASTRPTGSTRADATMSTGSICSAR